MDQLPHKHVNEELVHFKHTTGSKIPRFDLIPYDTLVALADRFELGEIKHKNKCWNARSNQQGLDDPEWVVARAMHIVKHSYLFMMKYLGMIEDDGDSDAAAIMWGGALLFVALKRKKDKCLDT